MNTRTGIVVVFATALLLTPLAGLAQGHGAGGGQQSQGPAQTDRGMGNADRAQDRDRVVDPAYDRDRIQDRTHSPDFGHMKNRDIYGNELMTKEERKTYRKQLAIAGSSEERAKIEAKHRKEMQARAESKGVAVEPPGRDIYGGAMMSVEERNAYREHMRLIGSDREERTRFLADHKEKMQLRANAQGVALDPADEEAE